MKECLTAGEAKLLDKQTIEFGIHELELMERAARGVEKKITELFDQSDKIVLLCGMGNNGGDALAAARMLADRDYPVTVVLAGDEERASDSWKWQKEHLCVYRELRAVDTVSDDVRLAIAEADAVVDGLFGIGLSRDVSGVYEELIDVVNASPAHVIAVDIASGINTDTGQVMKSAIRADETVTFGYKKVGHVLHPGRAYSGEVHVCDIGFLSAKKAGIDNCSMVLDEQCLAGLPARDISANKGTFGKVYIRAGSAGMAGAALLCGEAAYRTGVGLVYLSSPEENRVIIQMGLPEAVYKGDSSDYLTLRTVDAALLGPGLSTGDNAVAELKRLLGAVFIPMVLDADALNIMSLHDDVALLVRNYPAPKILTPHVGEMGRLLHRTTAQVKADMVAIAKEAARIYGAVVVLKDASTVITDGNTVRICDAGSDGAGCGGSGDVLSGIIAGLLAGGCSAFDAAVMGVYIHDRAGFIASEKLGPRFMLSRDIIDCMKEVLR